MITVERYLIRQIAAGLAVAALVLMPLFSFLDLLDQLDEVGKGFFQTRDAFLVTLYLVPRRFVQLAPFIALLGNVIGLGRLAVNRELTAMRAAGVSAARISGASLVAGGILLAGVFALDATVAPELEQRGLAHRSSALSQSTELGKTLGIWTRDRSHVLRLGAAPHAGTVDEVEVLSLAPDGTLAEYLHASSAELGHSDQWRLHDVTVKKIHDGAIETEHTGTRPWRPFIRRDQISALNLPPDSLTPLELYRYVAYLRKTGQTSDEYALAFWRKFGLGLVTIAMLLLSAPFTLGSVRAGIGARLILAAVTGITVYLFDQIAANLGLLLHLPPSVVGLCPGLVLVAGAGMLLHRVA